jgi:regulator of protease activity HflC (stomatin/prohibitin superfamily)
MTAASDVAIDVDDLDVDDTGPRRWYHRLAGVGRRSVNKILVVVVLLTFALIFFWPQIFITIHSGHVGVLYLRFGGGTQTDRVFGEGMKIIAPWDKLFIYETRIQETKHEMDVLTQEGLKVKLLLSVRYHPQPDLVGLLHERIGPEYKDKVVIPEVESALRFAFGGVQMSQAVSSGRTMVQGVVHEGFESVEQKFVKIDDVILREVVLPDQIRQTIEQKMQQKELAESYVYRIAVAEQEAKRREIEAASLAAYNTVLRASLSAETLQWAGIEATKELAKSPNAKTIIVGSGPGGLPMILNPQ